MQLRDDVRPGEVQQVRIALDVGRMVAEPLTAEVLLRQAAALQEHAPRPVEDDDAFAEERCEVVDPVHELHPNGGRCT